jgi:SHS2 domain-containing protein
MRGGDQDGVTSRAPFEVFDVTADIGIVAYGDTVRDLFENAARGMFALMTDPAAVRPERVVSVEARGEDLAVLLAAWLNELLFRCEVEGWVPADVHVREVAAGRALGDLSGEPADPGRHTFTHQVKAATYHLLECRKDGDRWRARVVFDV